MIQADTMVHASWVLTVDADDRVLADHSLIVQDGRILAIVPRAQAEQDFRCESVVEAAGHALLPGLINAHTHAAMSLLRGLADDLPLMDWLQGHIWPAESRWVDARFIDDGSRLAMAEMIAGGTTCFNDMYFFPDVTARAASGVGMRAVVGMIVLDFPTIWADNADTYLSKGLALHDQYRSDPLISTAFAPHAPYTVSDAPLEKIRTYLGEIDCPVHMHVHETAFEVAQAVEQDGRRPLQRLAELGLLTPSLAAVHMTQLDAAEIELIAEHGCSVVHCPESNLKLASGLCPVARLLDAGVNVALGTDGAASNNDLDMLGEMRTAALLAKGVSGNAAAVPAARALRMATINGAQALGLDSKIGSLEPGKLADMITLDLSRLATQPLYDPVSQIVYACGRDQVRDVWVGGRQLLRGGVLTSMDQNALLARANDWAGLIAAADHAQSTAE